LLGAPVLPGPLPWLGPSKAKKNPLATNHEGAQTRRKKQFQGSLRTPGASVRPGARAAILFRGPPESGAPPWISFLYDPAFLPREEMKPRDASSHESGRIVAPYAEARKQKGSGFRTEMRKGRQPTWRPSVRNEASKRRNGYSSCPHPGSPRYHAPRINLGGGSVVQSLPPPFRSPTRARSIPNVLPLP